MLRGNEAGVQFTIHVKSWKNGEADDLVITTTLVKTMLVALLVPLAAIPNITLNNGVHLPMISLGTWEYSTSVAQSTVALGLKLGYNHIDTANDYNNQKGVGAALAVHPRGAYS